MILKHVITKRALIGIIVGLFSFSLSATGKETLNDRQKAIIPIAAHTASGNLLALDKALENGLEAGLTINEIKEIFIHSYAYLGFPRALNGINTFNRLIDNRKNKGINDKVGKTATPVPLDFNTNAYGHSVRNGLVGRDISNRTTGYAAFVPTIDKFLVEHLFADIFYRDVLTKEDRELVTISMLSALTGTDAQLTGHLNISLRIGYSEQQLLAFTQVLADTVDVGAASRAFSILSTISDIEQSQQPTSVTVNSGESSITGTPDKFSGKAIVSSMFSAPASAHYRGAIVNFEKGARTAWHTHPNGQTLIIISGKGYVQQKGAEKMLMQEGSVVTIPPDTLHWHGATEDSPMAHVAISTPEAGSTVTWQGF